VPTFRSLVVFALLLVLLRRFFGLQISIVGSIVLTIVVSLILTGLTRRGERDDSRRTDDR
jgi:hypothetical protein